MIKKNVLYLKIYLKRIKIHDLHAIKYFTDWIEGLQYSLTVWFPTFLEVENPTRGNMARKSVAKMFPSR